MGGSLLRLPFFPGENGSSTATLKQGFGNAVPQAMAPEQTPLPISPEPAAILMQPTSHEEHPAEELESSFCEEKRKRKRQSRKQKRSLEEATSEFFFFLFFF